MWEKSSPASGREWKVGGVQAGDLSAGPLHRAGSSGKSQLFIKGGREQARLGGRDGEQEAALRSSKCETVHQPPSTYS